MDSQQWTDVEQYICDHLLPRDAALEAALEHNAEAGLPAIDVAPNEGKFLHLLARIRGARSILEIGTLGGYSTIWLARAVAPEGRVITLEANAKHAEAARKNLERARLSDVVQIRVGRALDLLPRIEEEGRRFDLIFVDADKSNNAAYFDWALKLAVVGTVMVFDNVVRDGRVLEARSADRDIQGTRRLYERIANEPRVSATALQTVGSKGYDGFALALVIA